MHCEKEVTTKTDVKIKWRKQKNTSGYLVYRPGIFSIYFFAVHCFGRPYFIVVGCPVGYAFISVFASPVLLFGFDGGYFFEVLFCFAAVNLISVRHHAVIS